MASDIKEILPEIIPPINSAKLIPALSNMVKNKFLPFTS